MKKLCFLFAALIVFCSTLLSVRAATVGISGYTNSFGTQPPASDWSTLSVGGAAADITTAGALDTAATGLAATSINLGLGADAADPANINGPAVWGSGGSMYLQTRPTGNGYNVLMFTLVNGLEVNAAGVTVSYDIAMNAVLAEEITGHRAFYSLSGAAGSWVNIPEFSSAAPGRVTANLNITVPPNGTLYLMWADDNGSQSPDTAVQIDNFAVALTPGSQQPASITSSPGNQTVAELSPASFTVGVSGFPVPTVQWYSNNVAIPGATSTNYSIASVALSFNGASYYAVAQNTVTSIVYSVTSAPAVLNVTADTTRPVLISVVPAGLAQVIASFSERVSAATAQNIANYSLTGASGALIITNATLDGTLTNVIMNVSPMTPGANYGLVVNNVADLSAAANTVLPNSSLSFTAASLAYANIGSPAVGGTVTTIAGGYAVAGAGTNIFGTRDQFTLAYQTTAGNFDVKVRVPAFTANGGFARAGLMARETLNPDARFAATLASPSIAGTYFQSRTTTAGNSTIAGWHPVNYPYTWLRLQRVGDVFTGYASFDGQNWTLLGSATIAGSPSSMQVGFAITSADGAQTATAQFVDYGSAAGGNIVPFTSNREPLGPAARTTGLVISEIMYNAPERADRKQTEFIEIYNSMSIYEDISGYRLSGDIDFTFPPGTVLQPGQFVVAAKVAADVQSVYGISGVFNYGVTNIVGTVTNIDNGLNNSGGIVRLHNRAGAVLLQVEFETDYPWPIEADGAGHSLVLARPSYGQGSRLAWAASDAVGGSPGTFDGVGPETGRSIKINEFLAHTDSPQIDYVELYNHGNTTVDISGFWLTDSLSMSNVAGAVTNRSMYRIPNGTTIGPRGFAVFLATTNTGIGTGFQLSSDGEQILLLNSNRTRVLDAIGFEGQENGVSYGRFPDGAPAFQRLSANTPTTSNAPPLVSPVVINEIMYQPISGNSDDEYVEIYNRSGAPVNLGNWSFTSGISFTFAPNTMLAPGAYMVVAKNAARMQSNYSHLNATNLVGNYNGSLANSGERLALAAPDFEVVTNGSGQVFTNVSFHYVVNEVSYGVGGKWGNWADGGGSSLELIDPLADNRLSQNWADSDESTKAPWTSFEATGVNDNVDARQGANDNVHVYMLGVGECLVDDVEVRTNSGPNVVINPGFESGLSSWTVQGSHDQSFADATEAFSGSRSLRLLAMSRGDTGANKIRSTFSSVLANNTVVTLRAKARWIRGFPEVLLRLHGGGMEAFGRLPVPGNLGSPGLANSTLRTNAGPAIYDVVHSPALPAASQAVLVTARVQDPQSVTQLVVRYRPDPGSTYTTVNMLDNGTAGDSVASDGLYTATIPGQAGGVQFAFHIVARDGTGVTNLFPVNALVRAFPNDAPHHEALIRWGDTQMPGSFATYHIWLSDATVSRWGSRAQLNNAPLDGTFVYNNYRVIYNMLPQYAGSPWHIGAMQGPLNTAVRVDYVNNFPEDDKLLGATDFVINNIGNPSGNDSSDTSALAEQTTYEVFKGINVVYNYRRYIHYFANGQQRSVSGNIAGNFIMEDSQQPNGDVIEQWWPEDSDGQLYKIEDWFEFNDAGTAQANNDAQLTRRTTTFNGFTSLKLAPYRFMWRKRSVGAGESANDYTNLLTMVEIVSPSNSPSISPLPDALVKQFSLVADFEQWMRIFACQHTVGNWDTYGYNRGKNAYTYRPNNGRFGMMTWDIDFTMGVGGDGSGTGLFGANDPRIVAMYNTPEIARAYWRAYKDIINGPLTTNYMWPLIDARTRAFALNNVTFNPTTVSTVKNYVRDRQAYIQSQLNGVNANWTIANLNVTSASNVVLITGTAPIDVKFIEFNLFGTNALFYPVEWTSTTAWRVRLPMSFPGNNNYTVLPYDRYTNAIPNSSQSLAVNYTGTIEGPQTNIVFNEIMANPKVPGAEYIELFNRSSTFTFDMSGWIINGLDYTFPEGSTLGPRQFLVLAKDRINFGNVYGAQVSVFDQFPGRLQVDGETLTLIKPGATPAQDLVVDKVRYEGVLPWPGTEGGVQGSSFQLIDSAQDNARVGNWFSLNVPPVYSPEISTPAQPRDGWRFVSATGTAPSGSGAQRLVVYLGETGSALIDELSIVPGTNAGVGVNAVRNGDFESPLVDLTPVTNSWVLGTNYTNSLIVGDLVKSGTGALKMVGASPGNAVSPFNRVIYQFLNPPMTPSSTQTLSFWYWATNSGTNLWIRVLNSSGLSGGPGGATAATNINIFFSPSNYVPPMLIAGGTNTLSPGTSNNTATALPTFQNLWINEVQPDNLTGIQDNNGQREPWIELYNAGPTAVSLDGLYLTTTYTNLTNWAFPSGHSIPAGQFLVVFCDGQPDQTAGTEIHTSFRLSGGAGSIALSRLYNNEPQVLDYVNYGAFADRSYGAYPDGQPFERREFYYVTAGGTNDGRSGPLTVFINEWMAGNANYLADPADFNYEDWFELYNPTTNTVNLAGYYLTDVLTNKFKFLITSNMAHTIPPNGYLLVWADNEANQNPAADLHVNFALSLGGEAIGLFGADGTQIDAVVFEQQTNDVSQGRFPNGSPNIYWFTTNRTPRAANYIPGLGNSAPELGAIGTRTIFIGQTLSFTASATDIDAGQTLTYSLDGGLPPGASIGSSSGVFTWTPTTVGTNFVTIRVTDNGVPTADDFETFLVRVQSLPSFATAELQGSEMVLTWYATPGRSYQLRYKDDLNSPTWLDYGAPLTSETELPLTISISTTNSGQRYFQLQVQ